MRILRWFWSLDFMTKASWTFGAMAVVIQAVVMFSVPTSVLVCKWDSAAPLLAGLSASLGGLLAAVWAIVFSRDKGTNEKFGFVLVFAVVMFLLVMVMTVAHSVGIQASESGVLATLTLWFLAVGLTVVVVAMAFMMTAQRAKKKQGYRRQASPARTQSWRVRPAKASRRARGQ